MQTSQSVDPREAFNEVPLLSGISTITGVDIKYHIGGIVLNNLDDLRRVFGQIAQYSAPQKRNVNRVQSAIGKFTKRLRNKSDDEILHYMADTLECTSPSPGISSEYLESEIEKLKIENRVTLVDHMIFAGMPFFPTYFSIERHFNFKQRMWNYALNITSQQQFKEEWVQRLAELFDRPRVMYSGKLSFKLGPVDTWWYAADYEQITKKLPPLRQNNLKKFSNTN